jgi:hypothetical protein
MKQLRNVATVLALLAVIASTVWALADSKSVNFLFEAAWQADDELPGGGIIVSRGEGSNGVITVDLPMPPPTEPVQPPIELNKDQVTYMDIHVTDDNGVRRHYTNEHIGTVGYRIELEYEWDNGTSQKYVVVNEVDSK